MQRVEQFHLWPGTCCTCGTTEGPGVDLDRSVDSGHPDLESRLYMCDRCIIELAEFVEFVEPGIVESTQARLEAMATEMEFHRKRAVESKGILRTLHEIEWLDGCGTCDWQGKALPQKARYCKVEECPHRKTDVPEPPPSTRKAQDA